MSEEEFIKAIHEIPIDKNNKTLSTFGSINVDDLRDAVKRLKKVPDYNDLLKENKQLKEQLQQKDEVINECIKIVNQWKNFCNRNYEEEPFDNISIQNNVYWKDCVGHLNYLLEILNKYKGDNNE